LLHVGSSSNKDSEYYFMPRGQRRFQAFSAAMSHTLELIFGHVPS
jgi:hypothetical protein